MAENKFYIDILKDYKDRFKNHLNVEDNYRTIFSGIFGIGKTTFLKQFFALEEITEEYEVIHLFPVNYSIASNEDIFELIKFDIFYRLLEKKIDFDVEDIALEHTGYNFILSNYTDILLPFLNFIPEVGGNIKEVAEKLLQIKNKFQAYHDKFQTNDLDAVTEFLNDFKKKRGTIYESDFYTELIIRLIIKLKDNNKKVVLIIDDLDRIDPEHIFRLLNIFSAHTDIQGNESNYNKFDFDKIIFVCDIDNIRHIYKSKFGIDTDFNGYIDKFYSRTIFHFTITRILMEYSHSILQNIKIGYHNERPKELVTHTSFAENFRFIIEQLFLSQSLSLRDLNRICMKGNIILEKYDLERLGLDRYYNTNFSVIQYYDILLMIYGNDKDKLLKSISNIPKNNKHQNIELFVKRAIVINILPTIALHKNYDRINELKITFQKADITINETYDNDIFQLLITGYDLKSEDFNYFKLLRSAFEIIGRDI